MAQKSGDRQSTSSSTTQQQGSGGGFGKRLAHTDKKVRDAAVQDLIRFLTLHQQQQKITLEPQVALPLGGAHSEGGTLDDLALRKLWKGLWYCYWMSDKTKIQLELATNLAHVAKELFFLTPGTYHHNHALPLGLRYIKMFWSTMIQEWHGIDRLRLDKFYSIMRVFTRVTFGILLTAAATTTPPEATQDPWHVAKLIMNDVLGQTVFAGRDEVSDGLVYHVTSIWAEEYERAACDSAEGGELTASILESFKTQVLSRPGRMEELTAIVLAPFITMLAEKSCPVYDVYVAKITDMLEPVLKAVEDGPAEMQDANGDAIVADQKEKDEVNPLQWDRSYIATTLNGLKHASPALASWVKSHIQLSWIILDKEVSAVVRVSPPNANIPTTLAKAEVIKENDMEVEVVEEEAIPASHKKGKIVDQVADSVADSVECMDIVAAIDSTRNPIQPVHVILEQEALSAPLQEVDQGTLSAKIKIKKNKKKRKASGDAAAVAAQTAIEAESARSNDDPVPQDDVADLVSEKLAETKSRHDMKAGEQGATHSDTIETQASMEEPASKKKRVGWSETNRVKTFLKQKIIRPKPFASLGPVNAVLTEEDKSEPSLASTTPTKSALVKPLNPMAQEELAQVLDCARNPSTLRKITAMNGESETIKSMQAQLLAGIGKKKRTNRKR